MKTILQVLAIVVAIIVGLNATKINKCNEDDAPSIKDIKVTLGDCKDETPCVLNRGETYNFEQQFKAPEDADDIEAFALGSMFSYTIEVYSASDPNACNNIQDSKGKKGACPLKKGEKYIYKKSIEIDKNEIQATTNIQWYLFHGNSSLTCFEIPLKIQDK